MPPLPRILITGATRGLGTHIAAALAPDHHLLIGGRDRAAAERCAAQWPSAEPFVADLTDADQIRAAVAETIGAGPLDAVVHNAGITRNGTVAELETDAWRTQFEVNLFSVVELTRQLLPSLRQAKGMVLTINSGAGFRSSPGNASYSATKWALRAFTTALREEERPHGVRVTSIHPGRVDTDMQRQIQQSRGADYDPADHMNGADVAATVRLALTMPHSATIEELSVRPT